MRRRRTAGLVAAALAAGAAPALAAPASAPGAAIQPAPSPKRPALDVRLRSLSTLAQPTGIVADNSVLRHRLIGSMIDFFPSSSSGFFLSGGGQLATRASIVRDVNSSLARLLYAPRVGGLRASGKVAPAATLGLVEGIGGRSELRIEGGALIGRMSPMTSGLPHGRGPAGAGLTDGGSRTLNGVMRASFGLRF